MRALEAIAAVEPTDRGNCVTPIPMTGGAVLSTLDCYLLGLEKDRETRPVRTNCNGACVVAEGEGSSIIGEHTIQWGKNDVFTLPHGQWISHRAASLGREAVSGHRPRDISQA